VRVRPPLSVYVHDSGHRASLRETCTTDGRQTVRDKEGPPGRSTRGGKGPNDDSSRPAHSQVHREISCRRLISCSISRPSGQLGAGRRGDRFSESPSHSVSACRKSGPEYPARSRRKGYLGSRSLPSLAAGECSVSNLHCSTYGPPRPRRAVEVRRTRASSHRGRVRHALSPSMSRGLCDKRIETRARAHTPGCEN